MYHSLHKKNQGTAFLPDKIDISIVDDTKAIELSFPIVEVSQLAERESYRKEIFRPIYHIHKWWANRLGSIFRGIVLGSISGSNFDIWKGFYKKYDLQDKIVLDPFMGSGTTLGEVAKLGAKPIGCDINPISTFIVRQALTGIDLEELVHTFKEIEEELRLEIGQYYTTLDPVTNEPISVLYYFWVKQVITPNEETLSLFKSYVFSKNACPKKKPMAQILCPLCWTVNIGRYDTEELTCTQCDYSFNPQVGPAKGQYVTDSEGTKYKIKDLLPKNGTPPQHKLYAMMALRANGEKLYLSPQEYDIGLLKEVKERLNQENLPLPIMSVRPGHNTNQARGYNYTSWRDFFNERQLLCLGLLLQRILKIDNEAIRDQFLCLFSSTLEFNNLFCSFKGEGTGAVRHLFSHHILKPERTPLENSVWGRSKGSGTFSSLFKSRLLKAKAYLKKPTEICLQNDMFRNTSRLKSTYITASNPIEVQVTDSWEDFCSQPCRALVLNGDSASLPIPDKSVDAIVTDPPYFDFVHYSELSDFFFAWLAPVILDRYPFFNRPSSYHEGEVQNKDHNEFAMNLSRVFCECHRVLKDDGVLSFSFHHSRPEGWAAIYKALRDAGFYVVASHPVHAEMKVASPKTSTKEPIYLDMILVCKKKISQMLHFTETSLDEQVERLANQLETAGIQVSQSDRFNIRSSFSLISASYSSLSSIKMG